MIKNNKNIKKIIDYKKIKLYGHKVQNWPLSKSKARVTFCGFYNVGLLTEIYIYNTHW